MPDHDAVADALARLANGAPAPVAPDEESATLSERERDPPDTPAPAPAVAEAEDAFARLSTAAAFVDAGGERRLSRAVAAAEHTGADVVAEQGRELLAAIDRFQTAAADETEAADGERPADHFHRGHTTLLTGDGVTSER